MEEKRENYVLAAAALAASFLTFIIPCSSPVGIALGIAAFCKSRGPVGKVLALASIGVCIVSVTLMLLTVLGMFGLQGAVIGCSACSNFGGH